MLLLAACLPITPGRETAAAESAATDTGECADAAPLTWDNWGEGFLRESCAGCHAATAADRYGAPEGVTFDTVEQAWIWSSSILEVATGASPTMPPAGGVEDDDRTRLRWWLACGVRGT